MTCIKCDRPRKRSDAGNVLLCMLCTARGHARWRGAESFQIQWPGRKPCAWQGNADRKDRRQWLRDVTKQMAKAAR